MSDLAKLRSRANREWEHPGAVGRYELISDIRTLLALLDAAQPAHPEGLDVERLARALGTHKWAWLGSTSVRKAAAAIAREYEALRNARTEGIVAAGDEPAP